VDVTAYQAFMAFFNRPSSVDMFLAEHVWEHLSPQDIIQANMNCLTFLKPGGHLRIAVPDALHPDPEYIEAVKPGGNGPGAEDHKVLFDHLMLRALLAVSGFARVIPLEWWDEGGAFHSRPWSRDGGFVRRSRQHDPRNQDRSIPYTSLIVDAVKGLV
jgi:predicted SAM-dependent methyltransferase